MATYANGRIPLYALTEIPWAPGKFLTAAAAAALARLDAAFSAHFGHHLVVNEAYRDLATQDDYKARTKLPRSDPRWLASAATPGKSVHGLAEAVDLGGLGGFGSSEYAWLAAHAPTFGWSQPAQYQASGPYPEFWHWERSAALETHTDPAPIHAQEDDMTLTRSQVEAAYWLMGRGPSDSEVDDRIIYSGDRGTTFQDLLRSIRDAREYRAFRIRRAYQDLLGRATVDPSGLETWLAYWAAGRTEADVVAKIRTNSAAVAFAARPQAERDAAIAAARATLNRR